MTTTAELRECPFCGGSARFVKHSAGIRGTRGYDHWHGVSCCSCNACVGASDRRFHEKDDAAKVWNTRPKGGEAVAWQFRNVTDEGPSRFWHDTTKEKFDVLRNDPYAETRELFTHPPHSVDESQAKDAIVSDALRQFLEAQDAVDNHELLGINTADYFSLVRHRNAAREELDAAMAEAAEGGV